MESSIKIKQAQTDILNSGGLLQRDPKSVVADVNGDYTITSEDFIDKYLIFDSGETIDVIFPEGLIPDLKGEIIGLCSNNTVLNFINGTVNVNLNPPQGADLSIQGEGVWGARALAIDKYSVYGSLDPLPLSITPRNFTGTVLDLSDVNGLNYNYSSFSSDLQYTTENPVSNGYARLFFNTSSEPTIATSTVITAGSFVIGETYTIETVGTTDFTTIGATSNVVGEVFTATGAGSGTGTAALNATMILGDTFSPNTDFEAIVSSPNGVNVEYYLKKRE